MWYPFMIKELLCQWRIRHGRYFVKILWSTLRRLLKSSNQSLLICFMFCLFLLHGMIWYLFTCRAQWLHAFYLGKLCEKLGHSFSKPFSYYNTAMMLNPTAVDPVYRIHASRLKLLYTQGKQNLEAIQVCVRCNSLVFKIYFPLETWYSESLFIEWL